MRNRSGDLAGRCSWPLALCFLRPLDQRDGRLRTVDKQRTREDEQQQGGDDDGKEQTIHRSQAMAACFVPRRASEATRADQESVPGERSAPLTKLRPVTRWRRSFFHLAICMTHRRRGPYWVAAFLITMLMWIALVWLFIGWR
jgi:hypothetical protein